jgi:EAL domain-containing protein (putative c-di-GMP-specific phosphodiesterase class I)
VSLSVVAEGVEDPALLAQLQEYGCDIARGFHLSKPIPPDQVPAWLNEHQPAEGQPAG